ncbi:MAG TPA: hypothetical protein V6C52_03705 [Coleofasciculaceae cyanobacterium]|jgi:hypothetical protein
MKRLKNSSMPRGILPGAILAFGIACLLVAGAGAQTSPDELASYEQIIFNHAYMDEPLSKRLERLESNVFGEAQSGSEMERRERLLKILGKAKGSVSPSAQVSEGPPVPESSDSAAMGVPEPGNRLEEQQPSRPPDATDYPKVTALEREVFSRDFIREPIENRLSRLEKKVFGQPYPQSALIDRVDKLLTRYPQLNTAATALNREQYPGSAIRDLPDNSSQFTGSSRDVYTKVEAMERRLLEDKTYPNELLTERLDRLERRIYGKSYSGESIDFRLSRLVKNFEVAENGTQPRPAFQSRPGYQSAPHRIADSSGASTSLSRPATPSPPQNIVIGSSIGQTSSHQYSQEMLDMLPADIRAQLGGKISGQSGSTVIGAPSTVIIERQTPVYSGFQQYGTGSPIQYYNYYGQPGVQTQSQTTTTVIQPDGSSVVYGYQGNNTLPGNVQTLPNPAYVGDPAFLQQLGNLELNLFGQVNTMEPVYIRLGKLETAMTGQIYPSYAPTQRLTNLQKTYQMQSIGRLLGNGKAGNIGRAAGSTILGVPLTQPPAGTVPPTVNIYPYSPVPPSHGGISP